VIVFNNKTGAQQCINTGDREQPTAHAVLQGPTTTGFTEEDIETAWKMLCPQGVIQGVPMLLNVLFLKDRY